MIEKFEGLDKWEVESALDCLTRAETIKKNTKLYAAAKKMAAQKIKDMEGIKQGNAAGKTK